MSRFQRLAIVTLGATCLLIVLGGIVRSTGSGMGCPDWPLCHGQLLPPLGDAKAWIEWSHRTVAASIGFLVLGLALLAWRDHRDRPSVLWPSLGAVVLVGFQAWLGKVTVDTGNAGEWVTAHLATAMILVALLAYLAIRPRYPARLPTRGASQRFTLQAAFAAASVYALLLFGAHVTATASALAFPDWPLFDGSLLPQLSSDPTVAARQTAHLLHRLVALVVGVVVLATAWIAWRRYEREAWGAVRARQTLLLLTGTAAALYAVQVVVGGLQVVTRLAAWSVTLHLALGALIWLLLLAAALHAWYEARTAPVAVPAGGPAGTADLPGGDRSEGAQPAAAGFPSGAAAPPGASSARMARLRAYVALTKPRIIELLLVTTVPAMFLAARGVPRIDIVFWTLVGGALAAGSANAINQYLEQDIDALMTRTRRRPLPAHAVAPEDALVFGLGLGVVAFAELAVLVNLLAAFLALVAIAFYVVVYTLLLKRRTPQNIVIGGAAGALPPVIGWAAVTGDVTLPALILFALVFYWTPPHFWALSLRLAKDYRAAGIPMLPVVRGVPETTRQIGLYTMLMVALSLILFAVARLGAVYLLGALVLGGLFLFQALAMWREGTDARAVRLYRYSTSYLAGLFALIVVDVLLPVTL
ncbi:MAG TPA: heme o synthase [Candidatus Limnocylindrales bacterium]|nr:heme o synthase [Candidatus Limnocylindrales bacterium]